MLPEVEERERKKYNRVWTENPRYRVRSHTSEMWERHRNWLPKNITSLLDIGCGTGRLLQTLQGQEPKMDLRGVDISEAAPDPEIKDLVQICPIHKMEWDTEFDVGMCGDVMEHIPEDSVDETLAQIHKYCTVVLYKISPSPQSYWQEDHLHLTAKPQEWWIPRLEKYGTITHKDIWVKGSKALVFCVE